MRARIFVLFLFAAALSAQQTPVPDCQFTASFTSATPSTAISDKATTTGGTPCVYWVFTYWTNNATGVSIQLEGTNDSAGSAGASFTALTATAGTSNPATGTTQGEAILCCDSYPWLRLNPTIFTGTNQTMIARVYGWRAPLSTSSSGGSVTPASVPNANKLGNSNIFQLAATTTPPPAGSLACFDVNGNTTSANCTVPPSQLTYYWTDTASDISTYLAQTAAPYSPKTQLTYTGLSGTTTTTLQNFATPSNLPNVTYIPAGTYTCHIHAQRTHQAIGTLALQCEFVEVTAAGVDVAVIGTSEQTLNLTNVETEYNISYVDGNVYTMQSSTSRIVARVQAVLTGVSTTSEVDMFVGDEADAHLSFPNNGGGGTGGVSSSWQLAGPALSSATVVSPSAETTVLSATIAANTLASNGDSIKITTKYLWGTTLSTPNYYYVELALVRASSSTLLVTNRIVTTANGAIANALIYINVGLTGTTAGSALTLSGVSFSSSLPLSITGQVTTTGGNSNFWVRFYQGTNVLMTWPNAGQVTLDTSGTETFYSGDISYAAQNSGGGGGGGGGSLPVASAQLQYLRTQPNSGNTTTYEFAALGTVNVNDYNFPSQIPAGSLTAATPATVTLSPCPLGVAGTDTSHYLYVATTGTPESVLLTGGTCTSGAASGTITFTPANNHANGYTVASATAGWQEAANAAGTGRAVYFPCSATPYTLHAGFTAPASAQTYYGDSSDCMTITEANAANIVWFATTGTATDITFLRLGWDGNFANQTPTASVYQGAILLTNSTRARVIDNRFHAFGFWPLSTTNQNISHFAAVLYCNGCQRPQIEDNRFYSIWGQEGILGSAGGLVLRGNVSGSASVMDSKSNVTYWDTMAGGFGWYLASLSASVAEDNVTYSGTRDATYSVAESLIDLYTSSGVAISNNYAWGMGNALGTIAVTNGNGTITGTNTNFICPTTDVNRHLMIEGDTTIYQVTTCSSATSIVVTPVVARGSASGLRYQFQSGADQYVTENNTQVQFNNNVSMWAGDQGFNVGTSTAIGSQLNSYSFYTNNYAAWAQTCGMWVGGYNYYNTFAGNYFLDVALNKVTGNLGAFCFEALDAGGALKTPYGNIFVANTAIDDTNAGATLTGMKYFMELDSAHATSYSNNILGQNFMPYYNSGLGFYFFNPQTSSVLSAIFAPQSIGGPTMQGTVLYANLGGINPSGYAPQQGVQVFCADCKNVADDSASPGAVCAGSTGHGALAVYSNSTWKCN